MRAVVQRVSNASVEVNGEVTGAIGAGFLVLLGAADGDLDEDLAWMVDKILGLRIFEDEQGKMNLSLLDTGGQLLLVSQFTLLADTRRGRRPSFTQAMRPEDAADVVQKFARLATQAGVTVRQGVFGAMMNVSLVNAGPVTIVLDSAQRHTQRRSGQHAAQG